DGARLQELTDVPSISAVDNCARLLPGAQHAQVIRDSLDLGQPSGDNGGIYLSWADPDFGAKVQVTDGVDQGLSQRQQFVAVIAVVTMLLQAVKKNQRLMQGKRADGIRQHELLEVWCRRPQVTLTAATADTHLAKQRVGWVVFNASGDQFIRGGIRDFANVVQ